MPTASPRSGSAGRGDGRGSSTKVYRGRVITSAAVASAMTAPGQTAAISVFVDPLIGSLGVSRSSVALAYSVGSLAGALVLPLLGRLLDRYGPRGAMAVIGCCFGAVLLAAGAVTDVVGLTAAFVGIRIGGQGALSLVATTAVAVYVQRRKGLAAGIVSAIGTSAISLAPLVLEQLIGELGWRAVWQVQGWTVLALTVPVALVVLPRHVRTEEDAGTGEPAVRTDGPADWTLRQASRTALFWVVLSGAGVCSLVTTALTFHQVSVLGERGLGVAEAAANFVPQLFAGLLAGVVVGWLADHVGDLALVTGLMLALALATVGVGWVGPGWSAVAYGLALGACTGGIRTLKAVVFVGCFGPGHLGALRGVLHAVIIGASALGPPLLAVGRAWSASYQGTLVALSVLPVLVVVAAWMTAPPAGPPPAGS